MERLQQLPEETATASELFMFVDIADKYAIRCILTPLLALFN
jgi:hypothetical protein